MRFDHLFSEKRVGSDKTVSGTRSGFQRDFDRLVFSSGFRRLQNKTQVFPLPGTAFVHNRLTHSLEVASVGRSLGKLVGESIARQLQTGNQIAYEFYKYELPNVIAAACLAHDIGNPAFGHSGEKAISAYFTDNASLQIDGRQLREYYNDQEWADITAFEGNANAIRVLTHQFKGKFRGGYGLTYTTIASLLKYPCESTAVHKEWRHRKKYGFFQSEKDTVLKIMQELGMQEENADPLIYKRHPFVYLVEAADDICYNIVDMEDAQRLGILTKQEVEETFFDLLKRVNRPGEDIDRLFTYYSELQDINEAIAFLRAKVINALTEQAAEVFINNQEAILEGTYNQTLIGSIQDETQALANVVDISVRRIYNHDTVVQVEIAGYNVMSELLDLFVPAMLHSNPNGKQQKVLQLVPYQFTEFRESTRGYDKTMNALDLISGMTDEYATELYRRVKGIDIPRHG
jgi:dGTPase